MYLSIIMPDTKPITELTILLQLIPDFDTSKNTEVYRFVRSCDAAFQLASTQQQQLLLIYALNKIKGPGSSDVHAKQYVTWASLKAFLIQKFSQTKTLAHLNLELQSLFQNPNETITEYYLRVDLCRSKVIEKLTAEVSDNTFEGQKTTAEETALNVFINGLNSDIGTMLRTKTFSNLSDAANFAIQEEKIRNMNKARQDMYKGNQTNSRTPHTTRTFFTTHQTQQVIPNQTHTAQFNTKSCNYCKKPGHVISECRKRAYNNNLKNVRPSITNPGPIQQRALPAPPARVSNLNSQAAKVQGISLETASFPYSNAQTPTQETSIPSWDMETLQLP